MKRRSIAEIFALILEVAQSHDDILAVVLEGSRGKADTIDDQFQDFDVVFLVESLAPYVEDHQWIDVFGPRIIMQTPSMMNLYEQSSPDRGSFAFLMLLADHHRIDLTLIEINYLHQLRLDPEYKVLLDKKGILKSNLDLIEFRSFDLNTPNQKEFTDCCNEFWWVLTYVGKGLCRDQILYAKHMMEGPVREMFLRMLGWTAGVRHGFPLNPGKAGKLLRKFFPDVEWQAILGTFSDHRPENMWKALFRMMELFHEYAKEVEKMLSFKYNTMEAQNVRKYLEYLMATY